MQLGGPRQKGVFHKVALSCDSCGKAFERYLAHTRGQHYYCSRPCYWSHKKITQVGENAGHWKGGIRTRWDGYIEIRTRFRGARQYTSEHILLAEKALGRLLKRGEVVHHINGDKADNRPCNLLICTNEYHAWLHQEMSRLYMREHFAPAPSLPGVGEVKLSCR